MNCLASVWLNPPGVVRRKGMSEEAISVPAMNVANSDTGMRISPPLATASVSWLATEGTSAASSSTFTPDCARPWALT